MEVILVVCLIGTTECRKESIVMDDIHTPSSMHCMMMSLGAISDWQDKHPKWFVKEWACKPLRGRSVNI